MTRPERVLPPPIRSRRLPAEGRWKKPMLPAPVHRLLELLTGATTWVLITAPVWGAVVAPAKWAWFAMAFSLYWLYKSMSVAISATLAYRRLRLEQARDWLGLVRGPPRLAGDPPSDRLPLLQRAGRGPHRIVESSRRARLSARPHERAARRSRSARPMRRRRRVSSRRPSRGASPICGRPSTPTGWARCGASRRTWRTPCAGRALRSPPMPRSTSTASSSRSATRMPGWTRAT